MSTLAPLPDLRAQEPAQPLEFLKSRPRLPAPDIEREEELRSRAPHPALSALECKFKLDDLGHVHRAASTDWRERNSVCKGPRAIAGHPHFSGFFTESERLSFFISYAGASSRLSYLGV